MKLLKLGLVPLLSLISLATFSQDFTQKVKDNALVVFSMNGKTIMNKVPEDKVDVSRIFNQFKKELRVKDLEKLSDLGFDFNSTFVYAMEADTNMIYNMFYMPISDINKFETLLSQRSFSKNPEQKKGYKQVSNSRKTEYIVWNSDFAVFVIGNYTGRKFQYSYYNTYVEYNSYEEEKAIEKILKEDTANKLTIKEKSDKVDEILKKSYVLSDYEDGEEIPEEEAQNSTTDEEKIDNVADIAADEAIPPPAPEVIEIYDEAKMEETVEMRESRYSRNNNSYYSDFNQKKRQVINYRNDIRSKIRARKSELKRKQKSEYISGVFKNRFNQVFNQDIAKSIANENSFKKSRDDKADGILWMRNDYFNSSAKLLMHKMLGRRYWRRRYYGNSSIFGNSFYQFGEDISVTKLFFEKKGVRITKTGDNNEVTKKATNEIFNTKQDARFFDYIDEDNFIGYISSSLNSEAVIKQLPPLWTKEISKYSSDKYAEEMNVLADLIEVFLDEKAIGELATGNAFFVLKEMKNKEVTYTSYEYDENYNSTRVEKTRTELRPEFLLMVATKNESMLSRILNLGIKNELITQKGKYFCTENKRNKFPLDLFFAIKDGIVFITTDETEIVSITNGIKQKGLDKKHKKLIGKNSQVVYYDNSKVMKYIPEESVRKRNQDALAYYKENGFEKVLFTTRNDNGNLYSEGFVNTPSGDNSAMYLFSFIEEMMRLDEVRY